MLNVVNVRTELIICGFAVILQFFLAKLNFWCVQPQYFVWHKHIT